MSDDRTDTNISSLGVELPPPTRQHPLPWVLFGVAVVLLAIVGGLLARRVGEEVAKTKKEQKTSADLQEQVKKLLEQQGELPARLADAEARAKAADEAKTELEAKVKKLEAEKGTAPADAGTTPGAATAQTPKKKEPAPPPTKKGKTKKKKKR